jgi:hypothetical protein
MGAGMKMAVFWVVAPFSLVQVYRRFRGACCLHYQEEDRGSEHLRNVSRLLPEYTALQSARHSFGKKTLRKTTTPTYILIIL